MNQVTKIWPAEENRSSKSYLFTGKDLLSLFVPLVIEQFLGFLVGLADSMMVASVGEAAVSGVSLVDFIMALLISIFAALTTGGAVVAAQYLGKRRNRRACEAANQLVWFVGAVSIGIMVLVYLARPFILHTMFGQISEEVRWHADTYLKIVALSIPSLGLYSAGGAIFRTMGKAGLPMKVALLMGIMNTLGNALTLYVFDLGTAGVALSTLFSRFVAASIIISLAMNPSLTLHIQKNFKNPFRWVMLKRIMSIGIPYGLENGLFYLGRLIVLGLVATFGTAAIAANAVAGTIVLFGVMPGMAIGLGLTVVIAKCVGANDYEQAKYYNKKIIYVVYATHLVMNGLVLIALPFVLQIYGLSQAATSLTTQIVLWHAALSITIWPLAYTLPVTFRAAGDAKYPMYVGVLSMFFCRIAMAYVLGGYFGMGVLGTWLAMFLDWIVKAGLFIWRYFSSKWARFQTI